MVKKSVASTDFLTVACKLPNGLHIKIPEHRIDIKLHGFNSPHNLAGHGMTHGVNAAQWAIVAERHKEDRWLTSGAVFAMSQPEDASARAKEHKDELIGFEAIDPRAPNAGLPIGVHIQPEGEPDVA